MLTESLPHEEPQAYLRFPWLAPAVHHQPLWEQLTPGHLCAQAGVWVLCCISSLLAWRVAGLWSAGREAVEVTYHLAHVYPLHPSLVCFSDVASTQLILSLECGGGGVAHPMAIHVFLPFLPVVRMNEFVYCLTAS